MFCISSGHFNFLAMAKFMKTLSSKLLVMVMSALIFGMIGRWSELSLDSTF